MRPSYACTHGGSFIEAEQAMNIVDQYVELSEKVLAKDAPYVEIDSLQILEFIDEHILVCDGVGAGLEHVHGNVRSRLAGRGACHQRRATRLQTKCGGQGRVNQRDLHSGIQEKLIGPGMIDGHRHNHLMAVYEDEGYTCDISRAMGFRLKGGKKWLPQEAKEASHLKLVIARAPQPGRLRSLWARGSTWS